MTIDVGRLPTTTLTPASTLHRIHRLVNDPWHFDASPHGRFNPIGLPSHGCCYWAEEPLGAFVEVFRTRLRLTENDLEERQITTITLKQSLKVVDLTNRHALAAGVSASIVHGPVYNEPQALARQLAEFAHGIRWRLRHDLAQELIGIALFGRPGEPFVHPVEQRSNPIAKEVIEEAGREFGYEVLPTMPS